MELRGGTCTATARKSKHEKPLQSSYDRFSIMVSFFCPNLLPHRIVTHHADGDAGAGIRAHLLSLHDPHVFSVHGPVVTLDDHTQVVRHSPRSFDGAQSGSLTVEVWAAHWSPKRWLTSAELIVADPPLLDGPLHNARAVRQRIVLAERGGVPLVDKVLRAQSAGALGVIITDTGDCTSFDQNCSPVLQQIATSVYDVPIEPPYPMSDASQS